MVSIGLAWTLTLVGAYLSDKEKPELPPTQGIDGMTDLDLYQQIENGDPLGSMTFEEAVVRDPRRIEALVLQRVIQPFTLALAKLENPNMDTSAIRGAMAHAYLERNHQMRQETGKKICATQIAEANKRAWRMNAKVLKVAWEMETPESRVLKDILTLNQGDIQRAFRESQTICDRAARASVDGKCSLAWKELEEVLGNMCDMIDRNVRASTAVEVIDDEMLTLPKPESMGQIRREDLFGALSFDEALADEEMGAYEFEEYIVTGHRAPSVGLSQFRRMGGRVFGALDDIVDNAVMS